MVNNETAFVKPLQLPQRSRVFVQLTASFLLILSCVYAYYTTPCVLNAMPEAPHKDLKDPKIWIVIVIFILCIIPAVFVFFLLKREFHFVDDNQLDNEPQYKV